MQREMFIQKFIKSKIIWESPMSIIWILIALFIFVTGWVEIKTQSVAGIDTFAIWLNKAKSIYVGEPFKTLTMTQYPALGPMFWAFTMRFTGRYEPIHGLFLGPVAYGFWILAHLSLFKKNNDWVTPAIIFPIAIFFYDDAVYNGYQDKILMMCAGMAVLTFTQFFLDETATNNHEIYNRKFNFFWLGAFFTGMLSLIKAEGMIMGLIIFLGVFFIVICFFPKEKRREFFLANYPATLIFAALLLVWPLILFFGGVDLTKVQGDSLSLQSSLDFFQNLDRFPVITLRHINYIQGILPIFTISVLLTLLALKNMPKIRVILSFIWLTWLLHLAFITFIFMVTRAPLNWHLDTAFYRLSSQHDFIYPLTILLVISTILREYQTSLATESA